MNLDNSHFQYVTRDGGRAEILLLVKGMMSSAMAAQITSSFFLDFASQAPFFSTHCKHLIECRDKRKADFVLGPCLDYLSESESPGQTISCES